MVNVQVVGRLGNDSEIKNGKNGQFVTFSLATDEYKNGKNETAWLNVVDYSDKGMKKAQYLKKGSMVNILGVETVSIFTNRNGEPQISRDIKVHNIDFVNSGGQSGQTSSSESTTVSNPDMTCGTVKVKKTTVQAPSPSVATNPSDDLPF